MEQYLFALFTVAMFTAAALAGYHAFRQHELSFYAVSLLYGFVLEQLVILRFEAYAYPVDAYPLAVFDVPLAISFGWGAILYTGYIVATYYNFSALHIPLFAALFALHIDLSMDVIAAYVGFWTWTDGGIWFGIPLGNFFGWFCVAFFYTGSYLAAKVYLNNNLLASLVAILASLVLLIVSLELWIAFFVSVASQAIVLALVMCIAFVALVRADYDPTPIPKPLQYATYIFHLFFLGLYLATGMVMHAYYVFLAPITIAVLAIGYVVLHQPTFEPLGRIGERIRSPYSQQRSSAENQSVRRR